MQKAHRPGPLHQTNKPHKAAPKHRRKSSATALEPKSRVITKSNKFKSANKAERINQVLQNRKLKRERAITDKRKLGRDSNPPIVVGLLNVHDEHASLNFIAKLSQSNSLKVREINSRTAYVISDRLKTRFKLISLSSRNFDESLDIAKCVDVLMLLHRSSDIEQDEELFDSDLLRAIHIHCLPTLVHVIDGLDEKSNGRNQAKLVKLKRALKAKIGDEKMHALDSVEDYMRLFHIVSTCKRQKSPFKEARPSVETDSVEIIGGNLTLLGYVRNKTLNPNDLVHVQGYDDYQMKQIDILPEPVSLRPTSIEGNKVVETLRPDSMRQETLEQMNELDEMEGEQTWPTAEELAAEAERRNTRRVVKRLPPGTSEYQGAWIPDSDEEDAVDEDDDEDLYEEAMEDEQESSDEMEDAEDGEVDEADQQGDDEEMDAYSDHSETQRQAKTNEMFPDEVDTPTDVPARVRFAKYRGLKSFRTSDWDPQENLPADYAKIFQFQNFQQTKRRATREESREGANPGQYVRVHLVNVPKEVIDHIFTRAVPPNLIGLLKHERKMTVMNYLIKRVPESDLRTPIKSKDELIFYVGFRKFKCRPLFTTHGVASKFKYERFLRDDVAMVATTYSPITFPPAPVLVFRQLSNGFKELVATGSVLDSNPNRLIIKRIRLGGHPFKIHYKSAVVRFMFYNSEDVVYFKPVELTTRYNRRGHITEPLGTHGHFKCTFDKVLRSDDCLFMNLYKRVFPKWTYAPVFAMAY